MSPDKAPPVPERMLIPALSPGLCLAYANTLFWRGRQTPTETLRTFADLLGWLDTSANIDAAALRQLAAWSHDEPQAAAQLLADGTSMREALYGIFSALAAGGPPPRPDFATLQRSLANAPARRRIARLASGHAWEIAQPVPTSPPDVLAAHVLAPVLWSAGDLLVGDAQHRVRRCANDACLWLFLDESKNATRRWCDMASCGNRAKARRHYLRTKGAAA
jgi:predicted RNA-binding Zn ribbon-like protein